MAPTLKRNKVKGTVATITAPVGDDVAAEQQASVIAERFRSDDIDRVLSVGTTTLQFANALAKTDYRPRLIVPNYTTLRTFVQNPGSDLSVAKNSIGAYPSSNFDDPALQRCFKIVTKATGYKIKESVGTDEPDYRSSAEIACRSVALFAALAGEAGDKLTVKSFGDAAEKAGTIEVPGSGKIEYDPATSSFEQPIYIYRYDTATKQLVADDSPTYLSDPGPGHGTRGPARNPMSARLTPTRRKKPSQLAVAVLDAEAEREAQQAAAQRGGALRRRPAARRGRGEVSLRQAARASAVSARSSCCSCCTSFDELESADARGARARHPRLVRRQRRRDRVHRRRVGRVPRARRAADGLARRPLPAAADHRLGEPRLRRRSSPLRGSRSTRSSCSGPASASAIAKSNTIPVHGSLIADTYPIGARGRISASIAMGARLVGDAQPGRSSPASRRSRGGDDGWRWAFLVLGIPRLRVVGDLRVPPPGAAARPVREAGRARRGHRGRAARADLDGGRVRPAQADPHASRRVILAFAAIGFGLFTDPVLANLFMEEHYGTDDASTAGCSARSAGIGVLRRPAVRGGVLRPPLPAATRRRRCGSSAC